MARHRSKTVRPLPPLLVRLIEAAEDTDRNHDAKALRAFGSLALWALPTRGVFVANDEEISPIVDRIAKEHLGLTEARKHFRNALDTLGPIQVTDDVESGHHRVLGISDEAYFQAGLAFGITLAGFSSAAQGGRR